VTSIGGDLEIRYNDALTSLTGLDNIDEASINDVAIRDNISLSACEVESICDYLINPSGEIEIHDNATGCNSISEVEDACGIISQSCLHEGVTFSTQEQIDSFQINYPGCTKIVGDVAIEGLGSNITNLNGLSVLTSLGGELNISFTALSSLSGLDSVTSIAGRIYIYDNDALTNLVGLEAMMSLEGGLSIAENDVLESLTGLNALTSIGGHLTLDGNSSLTNLTGLNNVTSIGGWVEFWCCDALTSFTGLDSLTYIGGGLCIWTTDQFYRP